MMRTAALILLLLGMGANAQTISIDPANPHYYFFQGKPTVLVTSAEHYGAVVNLEFHSRHRAVQADGASPRNRHYGQVTFRFFLKGYW